MVSLVVVNVACLGGVNVAGDRCGVRVVDGAVGRRSGREGGGGSGLLLLLLDLLELLARSRGACRAERVFHPPSRASWTSSTCSGRICRTSRIRPRPAPAAKGTRRVRGGKYGGVNRRWVVAHLGVVARLAHHEALVGDGVLLVLGLQPHLDVLVLAPDAGAHRVRARGLRGKSRVSDRVGQDVQSKNAPPCCCTSLQIWTPCFTVWPSWQSRKPLAWCQLEASSVPHPGQT